MTGHRFLAGWLVLLGVSAIGCSGSEETGTPPVATWDRGRIDADEHQSWLAYHGLDDSPEAVREHAYVASMAEESRARGAKDEPRTRLEIDAARRAVLLPALRDHVGAEVAVSAAEVEAAMAEHPEAFRRPRKLKLRGIYLRIDEPGSAADVRRQLEVLRRRLVDGADFEELARTHSQSQSRFKGGLLGFVAVEDLPPAVSDAVRDLAPGELSEVVAHSGGVSIFRCEEIRDAVVPGTDEVRTKIRTNLIRQRKGERWSSYLATALDEAEVRIDPAAETVLEMSGYRLAADDIAALAELRPSAARASGLGPDQIEGLLRWWAGGVVACRRAAELGLDRSPEVARALHWSELDVLARSELRRRVDARLEEPAEAELRRRFDAAPGRFREPASWRVAVLHFGDPGDGGESGPGLVEKAVGIARGLELGDLSFEEAARRFSVHVSARRGGDVGWRTRRQLVAWDPAVGRAVTQLVPGQQTGLLRLRTGLWIVEVRDFRPARPLDFEEALPQVREAARRERVGELEGLIRAEQLARIGLTVAAHDASPTAPPVSTPSL